MDSAKNKFLKKKVSLHMDRFLLGDCFNCQQNITAKEMRTHWNMERGGLKSTNVGETSTFPLVQFCQSLAIIINENATSEDPFFCHVGYCIKLKMQQVKTTFFVLCFFFTCLLVEAYLRKYYQGSIYQVYNFHLFLFLQKI